MGGSNCWQPCSLRSLFLLNVCEIAARATPTEQCVAYDEHDEHDEIAARATPTELSQGI